MIHRQLAFIAISLLFSGVLLLTLDAKIYAVNHMYREKKYARIFGWVQLSLSAITVVAKVLYI